VEAWLKAQKASAAAAPSAATYLWLLLTVILALGLIACAGRARLRRLRGTVLPVATLLVPTAAAALALIYGAADMSWWTFAAAVGAPLRCAGLPAV
jgi:hypothetical protein